MYSIKLFTNISDFLFSHVYDIIGFLIQICFLNYHNLYDIFLISDVFYPKEGRRRRRRM